MKLTKLQLENFRNYKKHVFEFSAKKDLTVLVGPNGMGKTNFLEAIYVLSLGKSFRSLLQDNLIKWDDDFMRCTAKINDEDEEVDLEVFYSSKPIKQKNFKKNGVNLKNSEYLGNLLTVLFQPEDLNMLYLGPSLRRRYMDILLSQTDKKYLNALSKYKKVLKQRNTLLQQIREHQFQGKNIDHLMADLEAWDRELVEYGVSITEKRNDLVKYLNENIEGIYQNISDDKDKITVDYESKILKNSSSANTEELYISELGNRKKRDIFRAETSAGPHRDELLFFLNGKEISRTASRGEYRTILLAIKLAEISYIKEKTGKNPVLLLDDVFSELDRKRKNHLLKSIKGCQTIITTTDVENLGEIAKGKASIEFVKG
ncbi:MAG: DNA replication/repair protein RecF [bacterium]|nr:DNA replication/repair protein RecF [bacterium]